MLAPVELAAIDYDTSDGGTMASDPLGRRVDDNIGTVVDRTNKVATGTECVVNLYKG